MAMIETWFDQDLLAPVPVHVLSGVVFDQDSLGNLIGVRITKDGEPVTLTGSVNGYCILSDGSTIPVDGSRDASGNNAWIILPQSAYLVLGTISIVIKLTDGNTITTLCACVGTVRQSKTSNMVEPGSTVITDWSQQISAELQACQDAADNMGANLASAYSTTATYPVGSYVMYDGTLYRCITAVTTAGSWSSNSSKFVATKLANDVADLKSALVNHNAINVLEQITKNQESTSYNGTTYTITDGVWSVSGTTSGNFTRKIYESLSVLPDWFAPGKTIYIKLNKTGNMDSMRIVIYPAYNGVVDASAIVDTRVDMAYTVPSDYTGSGLVVRLFASKNVTLNGTCFPEFLQALDNNDLMGEINALGVETIKYVSDPATVYAGMTFAEVNDNARMLVAKSYFTDIPYSGQALTYQTSPSYNVQILVRNSTGAVFTRIVNRTDHSVYRDWAQHALLSDINYLARFNDKKVYCDGDSIMYGVTTYGGGVATQTIPQTIALRIPTAIVENKAHGGDVIKHTGNSDTSISESIMADSTVKDYDYFVINGGTNDFTQDVSIGMLEMAEFVGEFSPSMNYLIGQGVTYNNGLYYFKQDHDAGAWNDGHVGTVENYAGVFSPSTDYQAGQYVTYADPTYGSVLKLFQFAKQHNAGAWKDPYPNVSPWAGNTTDVIAYDRTFYNGLHTMIRYIIQQTISNNKICGIMLITPIFRNYSHDLRGNAYNLPNRAGETLSDYCDAICNIGELYSIPVYDSRHNAPFNEMNYKQTLHLRSADSTGYLHPTDAGYKVWGQSVASYFLSNF